MGFRGWVSATIAVISGAALVFGFISIFALIGYFVVKGQ